MSHKISLKEAERKVFATANQDGLWDIFVGSVFLIFVIAPFLSTSLGDFWSSAVFLPFWGLLALAIRLVRKSVVVPRVGMVEFGLARKTRLKRFSRVMLIVNLAAFVLGLIAAATFINVAGLVYSGILGLILLTGFSLAAYFLDMKRLYVYGLLAALSPLVGEWLYTFRRAPHHGFPITFGVTSGIMILAGLFLFVRLVRNNPMPTSGAPSVEV